MNREIFDVLDKNGDKTGETKLRTQVHKDGDWHKSVFIWIINSDNKMLIQKRSAQKDSRPNQWDASAAGHMSAGENSLDTAINEVREELGLHLSPTDFEFLFDYKHQSVQQGGKFINNGFYDVYLVQKDIDLDTLTLQPEEVAEVNWVSFDELEKAFNSNDPSYVPHEMHYEKLFKILEERFPE
jgi:isopentenyldiphosphate isomerase